MLRFLPNAILLIFIFVLGIVQVMLSFEFWSTFASENTLSRLVFQVFGVGLAVVEMIALLVAANADDLGKWARAAVFRVVFAGLFAVNFACDLGAIYTFTSRDAAARSASVLSDTNAATELTEWIARRDALHMSLAEQDLDLPSAALIAQRDAAIIARDAGGVSPRTQLWRTNRAAGLDAAVTTALEIEGLDQRISAARSTPTAPHGADHPQIEALLTVLAWLNVHQTSDTIRLQLALAMAIVLRCVLAFGPWVAIPGARKIKPAPEPKPERAPLERPEAPSARRKRELVDMMNMVSTMHSGRRDN